MHERSFPSARRAGAQRHAIVDYASIYCGTCGRVGFASRCSACAAVVCVDSAACHPRHRSREYAEERAVRAPRVAR